MPVRFDPEEWNRQYESRTAYGFVFRRSAELALELSRPLIRPGQRWLDLGCGTGQLARALREAGAWVVGVDHDERMAGVAAQAAAGAFVVGRAEQIPLADATVDGVTATSLMGCVADASTVFAEIRRVLRPNGHTVITFTRRNSCLLKLAHMLSRCPHYQNYTLYAARDVTAGLEQLGFEVVEVRFYNFVLRLGRHLLPPTSVARLLQSSRHWWLARNFIVVARSRAQP